jgi:hypothetical protein
MTALQPENNTSTDAGTTSKNPYNTRRKSLYFSPSTHSATTHDPTQHSNTLQTSTKHPVHNPEPNPRSPKRLKRGVPVDGSFTPPPSPPQHQPQVTPVIPTPVADIAQVVLTYDDEDDPVINAIVHVLQLAENTPLSTRDLSSSIQQYRLCSLESPNPSSVVSSRITSHFKRRAAEKPPREPLLERYESENGRQRTAYRLMRPELVSDRSGMYSGAHEESLEDKVLRATPASKLNILSAEPVDVSEDEDEYDSEDISNRSPDRPTLFDPPNDMVYSPPNQAFDNLSMIVDIDVPTGIKLDYEFYDEIPSVPIDNLTPPSEEVSHPTTPLEVFSRHATPVAPSHEEETLTPPTASDEEPDDPQSPHSGAPPAPNTLALSTFYDSPLISYSIDTAQGQVEMLDKMSLEEDDDEVRVVEMHIEQTAKSWPDLPTWGDKRENHVPSPENVGLDELEEWLEGI